MLLSFICKRDNCDHQVVLDHHFNREEWNELMVRDRLEREALNPAADAGKCIVCGNNVQGSQGRSSTESRMHHMFTQCKDYPRSAAYEAF